MFLNATGSFGKAFGDDLGHYAGKRVKEWLEQLRHARGRKVTTIIQDPSVRTEIVITGDEPREAFDQLMELLNNGQILAIPGKAAEVRYRAGQGWVRSF